MNTLPDWLLVSTLPSQERRAAEHVQRQGMVAYLPQFTEQVVVRGKVTDRPRVLFPSYLFVQATVQLYHKLRSTLGVSRVVLQAGEPSGLSDKAMRLLRSREDAQGFIQLPEAPAQPVPAYTPGQQVRILTGPFAGWLGVVKGMSAMERVSVLMQIMGKSTVGQFDAQALVAA